MATSYTAYFDDGGHPDDQPLVLVAGFVSPEEQWKRFNTEWLDLMKKYEILDRVLHMTDFEAGIRPYDTWSDTKKRDFLESAAFWVNLRTRANLAVVVPMKDYLLVNKEYALEECMGAPYSLAARIIADGLLDWENKKNRDGLPLLTIFEDGTKHKAIFWSSSREII